MPQTPAFHAELHPHPSTPGALDARVSVDGRWREGGELRLTYDLWFSEPSRWRLPAPVAPGPADGLWQHSCAEAFVAVQGQTAYHEFNFSPSGQWAHYAFGAERVRDHAARTGHAPPRVTAEAQALGWRISATLPLEALPPSPQGWSLGLTAVLERDNGQLSYWALTHPKAVPDFHHPDGRCLRLPPPPL